MKKISLIHGPNLNMLGIREPDIYGRVILEEIKSREDFCRISVTKPACREQISGLGKDGYLVVLRRLLKKYA